MNTNDQNAIGTEQLQAGLAILNNLAQEEYHMDLDSVLTDPTQAQEYRIERVGRLLGIILKEPFATAVPISPNTSYTHAYRAWNLLGQNAFNAPEKKATWQYEVLEKLMEGSVGYTDVYDFAFYLQHERSIFWCLADSTRHYICPNQALKQKIDDEVKASKKASKKANKKASKQAGGVGQVLTTTGTGSTAAAIATILVQHVPWLAVAETPFIAGLVLVIIGIGIGAFCKWSAQWPIGSEK